MNEFRKLITPDEYTELRKLLVLKKSESMKPTIPMIKPKQSKNRKHINPVVLDKIDLYDENYGLWIGKNQLDHEFKNCESAIKHKNHNPIIDQNFKVCFFREYMEMVIAYIQDTVKCEYRNRLFYTQKDGEK